MLEVLYGAKDNRREIWSDVTGSLFTAPSRREHRTPDLRSYAAPVPVKIDWNAVANVMDFDKRMGDC